MAARSRSRATPHGLHIPIAWWLSLCSIGACVVAWLALTTWTGTLSEVRLPYPSTLRTALEGLLAGPLQDAALTQDIAASCEVVLAGFALASATGILLGIVMGTSRYAEAAIDPLFQVIRPIPPLAWIPLGILWFGLGFKGEIFIVWIAATIPAVINTHTAMRSLSPVLVGAALVHGATRRHLFTDVAIPTALPMIFAGLRLSLQVSWMAVVAAELVGSTAGLGREMILATRSLDSGTIAITMLAVAALGISMTALLRILERSICRWN